MNMKRAISSVILGISLALLAVSGAAPRFPVTLDEAERFPEDELIQYRQESYQLVDPVSDLALLRRSERVPLNILRTLLRGAESSAAQTVEPSYGFEEYEEGCPDCALPSAPPRGIQGRENPLRREGFERMLTEVIAEERLGGLEPSYGTPHEWSPEFRRKYGSAENSSPYLFASKLLVALAVGDTHKHMRTDREKQLYLWVVAQPLKSVTFPELFRQAYRFCGGDVYLALMTMENLLAHHWKFEHGRERLPVTQRLKPITSGHEWDWDRFGTWYHLVGVMLYGYVAGGVPSHLIGRIEALGANILTSSDKTQKQWFNREGGWIGADLAKLVRGRGYLRHELDPSLLEEDRYLNRTEDFRDRLPVALDPALDAYLDRHGESGDVETVRLRHSGPTLEGCTVKLMFDRGFGFDSSDNSIRKSVRLCSGEYARIPSAGSGIQAVRGFVSACRNHPGELAFEAR
ncbi:MAG: hypothetical protein NDJ89_09445 [Oligoflexia bacterium]|nr:hypothetical protein [Oligoflexia bacterium]